MAGSARNLVPPRSVTSTTRSPFRMRARLSDTSTWGRPALGSSSALPGVSVMEDRRVDPDVGAVLAPSLDLQDFLAVIDGEAGTGATKSRHVRLPFKRALQD